MDDQAADEQHSPESGGPDPDPLADEPCGYDRKEDTDVGAENENGSTKESSHLDRLTRSGQSATPVTVRFASHLGHIPLANALATRQRPSKTDVNELKGASGPGPGCGHLIFDGHPSSSPTALSFLGGAR